MKIKCVKCGHVFDTKRCKWCGKGVYVEKKHIFDLDEWVCNWCGHTWPTEPDDYCCPECMYNNRSKGCFITSACVDARGLADDCYELTTIRKFRDEVLKKDDTLCSIVEEYYVNAPIIVDAINKMNNNKEIYNQIYEEMIIPCIKAIEKSDRVLAVDIYYENYVKLKEKYLK